MTAEIHESTRSTSLHLLPISAATRLQTLAIRLKWNDNSTEDKDKRFGRIRRIRRLPQARALSTALSSWGGGESDRASLMVLTYLCYVMEQEDTTVSGTEILGGFQQT